MKEANADDDAAASPLNTLATATTLDDEESNKPSVENPVILVEETDESSSNDEDDGTDFEDSTEMPLFHYTRLLRSLPRDVNKTTGTPMLAVECTASVLGRVILNAESTLSEPTTTNDSNPGTSSNEEATNLWYQQSLVLTALGFVDGRVILMDTLSGTAVTTNDQLNVRTDRREPIVALSMDATGTQLAAIDQGGLLAIFTDLKYRVQLRSTTVATAVARPTAFHSFFSAFTGGTTNQAASSQEPTTATPVTSDLVPTLTLANTSLVAVQRVTYPSSFGRPTCLALDPAYKRRREKAWIVGFTSGRLVLTKRGMLFQRRNDAVVYQAIEADECGIQAVVWRGPLVAWADSSGIRLMDSDTQTRIAHVDRPAGARPTLYPTVSNLIPTLCFETSNKLLVAWGDCLLTLDVKEQQAGRVVPIQDAVVMSTGASELQAATGGAPVRCSALWRGSWIVWHAVLHRLMNIISLYWVCCHRL